MKIPSLNDQIRNRTQFVKNVTPYTYEKRVLLRKAIWLFVLIAIYCGITFA